ncbi:hypothetical protein J2067_004628 [Erwinia rhapontici]|nr:hypothetical protein [Erwinia rhapontici]
MNRMMTQDGYTAALRQDKVRVCAEGSPKNKTCIIGSHLLFRSASDAGLHDGSGQRQGCFAFPLRGLSDPGRPVTASTSKPRSKILIQINPQRLSRGGGCNTHSEQSFCGDGASLR